jgi:DNA-binding NarL/FixJ family response regulator
MGIRILLVDDHQMIRDGLRHLLKLQKDMDVLAEAEDGRSAVQLAGKLKPDVVILDVAMPDLNGIEAARQIRSLYPEVRIVALSMHSDRRFIAEMLKAGATGYLLKDSAFEELAQAVRTVAAGRTYLSPQITGSIVEDYVQRLPNGRDSVASILTPREREVLQLLAEGQSTKQIAGRLHVSVKTIETHRRQLMEKLNLHSVAELTKFAIREGLTWL